MTRPLLLVLATVAAARLLLHLAAPRVPAVRDAGRRIADALESRWAPLAIALATIFVLSSAWGSWNEIPMIHDEASYLFQAKLFAQLRWAAPSPPIPEFFEQFHVFVVPTYASKYPPGHSLLLVPGIWLGVPGLMPVVISGITAALVYSIARRVADGAVALLTWLVWITAPFVLWVMGSYFSQTTSAMVWMLGWYALLRWREGGERWLLLVAASVAWLGFTRPLTAVAYALPIGVYVLWRVARTRRWAPLARALALGGAMLLVIPLWSAKTIGTWRTTPYSLYSKLYFPWDAPGFGLDSTPPSRALPPDMAWIHANSSRPHVDYVPAALPDVLQARGRQVGTDMWGFARVVLLPFAVVGMLLLGAELAFAIATGLLLLLAYLSFYHSPMWSLYYAELQPLLAYVTALGISWALRARTRDHVVRRRPGPLTADAAAALVPAVVLALGVGAPLVRERAEQGSATRTYQRDFVKAVRSIPVEKSIVFVRYGPNHNPHLSLVYNEPWLDDARTWIVYDRGPDNLRLMAKAPDRMPLLFDQARHQIHLFVPARDTLR